MEYGIVFIIFSDETSSSLPPSSSTSSMEWRLYVISSHKRTGGELSLLDLKNADSESQAGYLKITSGYGLVASEG